MRALGWRGPILLLEGVFEARDLELCSRLNLWHTVHCDEQIDMLAMHKTHQPHRVFLKMNSGMNRLGFAPQRYRAAWTRLDALPQVDEISLMTHFSDADGERGIAAQLKVFEEITRDLPGERTLSNSAASLRHGGDASVRADWIRPGIAVYGSSPDFPAHDIAHWDLRPTMTLATRIIAVQQLRARRHRGLRLQLHGADAPLRIGVIACGYADGYPRHCTTGTPVLVDGVRTRLVGRVSMDMVTVDLTPGAAGRLRQRGHAVGPSDQRRRARHRRARAAAGTAGLRVDVRAGAAGAGRGRMRNLSNWRSVRLWESGFERELRTRHLLWLHGWVIGLAVLLSMWAAAHLAMLFGAVALGTLIDHFIAQAHSLPQAIKAIGGR